ncbi:MAG: long-chain acyl-CoA synthetase [Cognaticolwellia sp.]|jgi:long-chain acyl-CoA synthetase
MTAMRDHTLRSVPDILHFRVEDSPDGDAFYYPDPNESWQTLKWSHVGTRARAIAMGLHALGIDIEDRCSILGITSIDWVMADLGILCAGGATTTIYPSNTPEECRYILADSMSKVVFVDDDKQAAKMLKVRDQLPHLEKVVVFNGTPSTDGWIITMEDLETQGRTLDEKDETVYQARVDKLTPQHLATLIYTSGTTGTPKGVELTHDCWLYEAEVVAQADVLTPDDKHFLWLPLSHVFGKVLIVGVMYANTPTAIDGRVPRIIDNLSIVRPTVMAAAPRIFEKVYNKVVTGAQEKGGMTLKIFRWSVGVGKEVSALRQQGKEPSGLLALKHRIADRLVFSKLRERFGGRVRFFISGSAPLSREMAEFFHACGILILEGYGLTESSAASFVNLPDNYAFGTVGPALPGTEIKIMPEDGEILIRGRGVMRGYHNLPDVTAETLTEDGWLRTGDIGELDPAGRLRITDRKKALIKTSGGKYVAPSHLESTLKALCPYLSQVVVHGNNRNFCTALVTMDPESIVLWAKDHELAGKSYEQLSREPTVKDMIQLAVDELNASLPRYSTLKKFAVLPADFAVETGELTASLKVKRKVVEHQYNDILEGFYADAIKSV